MANFDNAQFQHFRKVEEKRFFWQTGNPFIVEKEKDVLGILNTDKKERILEVGCGEGANIFNMSFDGAIIGLDYSLNRLKFAKNKINKKNNALFICGDATLLPFSDNKFDLVFTRDLLHHLSDKKKAILEMIRVCKKKCTLSIIEMNGRSNLIGRIFASLVKKENGMKNIDITQIVSFLIEGGAVNIRVIMKQPILFYRVIFHYRLCFSWLSRVKFLRKLINLMERLAERIIPKEKWGYIVILADNA